MMLICIEMGREAMVLKLQLFTRNGAKKDVSTRNVFCRTSFDDSEHVVLGFVG